MNETHCNGCIRSETNLNNQITCDFNFADRWCWINRLKRKGLSVEFDSITGFSQPSCRNVVFLWNRRRTLSPSSNRMTRTLSIEETPEFGTGIQSEEVFDKQQNDQK